MQMLAWTLEQPLLDQRCFMGRGIVEHEMHIQIERHAAVDPVQKGAELHRAMALAAGADHAAGLDVQSGEEVGCAMTNIAPGSVQARTIRARIANPCAVLQSMGRGEYHRGNAILCCEEYKIVWNPSGRRRYPRVRGRWTQAWWI
jgi:hypothetical protein